MGVLVFQTSPSEFFPYGKPKSAADKGALTLIQFLLNQPQLCQDGF
jgi:hypothetical protein